MTELEEGIKEIANGEWFKSSSEESFLVLAHDLIANGYTEEDAVMFLESAYCAVSSEFGS